jgi:hypothetical protein
MPVTRQPPHRSRRAVFPHRSSIILTSYNAIDSGSNLYANGDECPHIINLKDFSIGKYEVTQTEWKEIMGDNPVILVIAEIALSNKFHGMMFKNLSGN